MKINLDQPVNVGEQRPVASSRAGRAVNPLPAAPVNQRVLIYRRRARSDALYLDQK